MLLKALRRRLVTATLAATAISILPSVANAEGLFRKPKVCCPVETVVPHETAPAPAPKAEAQPQAPQAQPAPQQPAPQAMDDAFADIGFAATGGSMFAAADGSAGYVDSALVRTQVIFRWDAGFDNHHPDRAEFFYARCGSFGGGAQGPPLGETGVDYQDYMTYIEFAASDRLSGFIEAGVRALNPEQNDNTTGMADMMTGFKYALYNDPNEVLTLQVRTYLPTGDSDRGLGTNHYSVEPGILHYRRLSDRLTMESELRDWISIDGFPGHEGNVLRAGTGLAYDIYQMNDRRITPVFELVGWTVLDGAQSLPSTALLLAADDADGESIVNAKFGVRNTWGQNSLYAGYGRAITKDEWYQEIIRVEFRRTF